MHGRNNWPMVTKVTPTHPSARDTFSFNVVLKCNPSVEVARGLRTGVRSERACTATRAGNDAAQSALICAGPEWDWINVSPAVTVIGQLTAGAVAMPVLP